MEGIIPPQVHSFVFLFTGLNEVSVGPVLRCMRSLSAEDNVMRIYLCQPAVVKFASSTDRLRVCFHIIQVVHND